MNDPVDLVQTVAIIFVMLILAYGVYLFKIELRAALMALRDIVREHDEIIRQSCRAGWSRCR